MLVRVCPPALQFQGDPLVPQVAYLQTMAFQAAEPQRGLSLYPEECALHSESSNMTAHGAEGAVMSFRVPESDPVS